MSESIIRVMCPNLRCRAVLAVPGEARGRLVRCRNCAMNIKIPAKAEPKADATPADGATASASVPAPAAPASATPKK